MKNKKIIIILVCLLVLFIVFISIGLYIHKNNNPTYEIDSENRFKNFMINIPEEINYKRLDDYSFELRTEEWYANVEPVYDEHNYIKYELNISYSDALVSEFIIVNRPILLIFSSFIFSFLQLKL